MPVRLASHVELEGPLKGYRLIDRLGRGGFGEVWKVEAPGGLLKAMKFVFGDLDSTEDDDSRPAEQELKALNRVKSIRHPYILSLERIDRIEGQLIIVMELADRNLWERFRECRGLGYPGIPRDELLRYMEETAEAIDLMNKHYHIQHLDVKPQNLFLVFNHIKVADFGLAKSFEGNRGTVTGGVTPVYAAPETFEGYASLYTDQYSLGIVFQELLTGTRPFNGSNVKQLLMQHLNGVPDLSPLPDADRPIIGRSLNKKPDDRWPSCTEMIQALARSGSPAIPVSTLLSGEQSLLDLPPKSKITIPASLLPIETATGPSPKEENRTSPRKSGVQSASPRPSPRTPIPGGSGVLPKLITPRLSNPHARPTYGLVAPGGRPADVRTTKMSSLGLAPPVLHGDGVLFPALVIGVGQTGLIALQEVRKQVTAAFGECPPHVRFLFVDTDPGTASVAMTGPDALSAREVVLTRLNRPAYYLQREGLPSVENWLPSGALYRLPRTSGPAAGVRAFGRLALFDHAKTISQKIRQEIEPFLSDEFILSYAEKTGLGLRSNQPRVYLLTGLAGGTGSGMVTDLAYLVKHELRQHGYFRPEVVGVLFTPPADVTVPKGLALANTFAALTELHYFLGGNRYQVRFETSEPPVTDGEGPFGRTVLFQLPQVPNKKELDYTVGVAACGLAWELATPVGRVIDQIRTEALSLPRSAGPVVQTYGLYRYVWPRTDLLANATVRFARLMLLRWAGKESSHLSEPIRSWLAEQWTKRSLDVPEIIERLNQVVKEKLREDPEVAFEALVSPLYKRTGGSGKIDAQAAVQVLEQILKLVGKPPAENDKVGSLQDALDETGKQLAGKADKHLAKLAVSFIEQPQYRLAGADEALAQISEKLKASIEVLEEVRKSIASEVRESYARLFPLIGALNSPSTLSVIGSRKLGMTSDLVEQLRVYPRKRLRLIVLDTALSFFRGLQGNCPEYSRDVQVCRTRIGDLIARIDSDPATIRRAGRFESYLLPPNCKKLGDMADEYIDALPPDEVLGFEQSIQQEIGSRYKALVNVCLNVDDAEAFIEFLKEWATAFLSRRMEIADPVELFFRYKAEDPKTPEKLAEAFDRAGPDLTTISGKAPAEATLLAAPATPAGDQLRAYVAEHLPGIEFIPATTPSEIAFFREYPLLPLDGLPQLAEHAKSAFEMQTSTGTSHCRTDIPWQAPTAPTT
ncbi:MAG TPA: tubulin-like doman-containing protein [Fimbriiglobus sp.]|jgi:serine/threonine protein kinase